MTVTFRFFSVSRDLAGCSTFQLDIGQAKTVEDALAKLYEEKPDLQKLEMASMFAVGLDYATKAQPIKDGDEISIIPPVQGG